MPRLEIKESTAKKLFGLSRNICARPECSCKLVLNSDVNLGEMCHIEGENSGSARYNLEMDDEQRRAFDNLIVLCNNCHTIIDNDVASYTVEKLKEMKKIHERKEGDLLELTNLQLEKIMEKERSIVQQNTLIGDGQQITTTSGNVNVQGFAPKDVVELLQTVIGGSFPSFEKSQTKMMDNVENFAKTFVEIGLSSITKEEREKFSDPDLRMALTDAVKIASRKSNTELHKILSHLIIQRVQHDDEIKQVVFNEAISVMGKLTANELKIITLVFTLTRVSWHKLQTNEDLKKFFEEVISKLIPFKDTQAEFGHLESVSCINNASLGSWTIIDRFFKSSCSNIFLKKFSDNEIQNLPIKHPHVEEIFEKTEDDSYKCKFSNKHELGKYLEKNLPEDKFSKSVLSLYDSHFISNEEISVQIESFPFAKQLLEHCKDNSTICHTVLTGVGVAIALTYLQIIANQKLDPDVWIN